MNNYYIVQLPAQAISQVLDVTVGTSETIRKSIDGTKAIVKTYVGDNTEYGFLGQKYTHEQILTEINKPEWNYDN